MRPGVKLPHEVTIIDRHEAGLPPLEEVSYIIPEDEETSETIEEKAPDAEEVIDSALEKMAEIESNTDQEEE